MNWEQLQEALLSPLTFRLFVVPMLIFFAIDALSYFSKISERHLDFKWFLTTWGLFGTFLGIFNGLVAFNTADIPSSVPLLLEGLKLAFLTSIMGMALATLLQIFQSFASHRHAKKSKVRSQRELLEAVVASLQQLNVSMSGLLPGVVDGLDKNQASMHKGFKALVTVQQQATQHHNESFKELYTRLEKQQQATQQINHSIKTLQEVLESIHSVLYDNRRHFVKLGSIGEELSDGATEWVAVQDNDTGLIWEHKAISGLRDQARRLIWAEETQAYVQLVNQECLAGFNDWHLPSQEELRVIQMVPLGPDQRFFGPLTDPAHIYSGIFSADPDPQDERKGMTVHRGSGMVKAARIAHVLLVRGGGTK